MDRARVVLLVLATVHFGNVFVFWRIRPGGARTMPTPVDRTPCWCYHATLGFGVAGVALHAGGKS